MSPNALAGVALFGSSSGGSDISAAVHASEMMSAGLVTRPSLLEAISAPHFTVGVQCHDRFGRLKWEDGFHNLVVTVGKNDLLDKYFKGVTYTAAWNLGLKGAGVVAAGDTLASHAGWAEVNPYTGNRPAISFGTSAGGSNTATAIVYAITASATVAGAFVSNQATGTAGILYSAGDFAVSRSVVAADTLTVTLTVSV